MEIDTSIRKHKVTMTEDEVDTLSKGESVKTTREGYEIEVTKED